MIAEPNCVHPELFGGVKIIGGCCGTDRGNGHMEVICKTMFVDADQQNRGRFV